MVTESMVERPKARRQPSSPADIPRSLRRMTLAVIAVFLLSGMAAVTLNPRLGLFPVAFILGWTQLVGH